MICVVHPRFAHSQMTAKSLVIVAGPERSLSMRSFTSGKAPRSRPPGGFGHQSWRAIVGLLVNLTSAPELLRSCEPLVPLEHFLDGGILVTQHRQSLFA
jgi:hypothetical protein